MFWLVGWLWWSRFNLLLGLYIHVCAHDRRRGWFFFVSYDFHEAAVAHCPATTRVTIATVLRTVFVRYTVGFQKHSIRVVANFFLKKGKLKTRVQIGDRK